MKKILIVATEPAPGMIPFVHKTINVVRTIQSLDIYALIVNPNNSSAFDELFNDKEHFIAIDVPSSKKVRFLYKFWPRPIINKIKEMDQKMRFDIIHFMTIDFSMAPFMCFCHNKEKKYLYTVHDLIPHERVFHLKDYLIHKYIEWGNRTMRRIIPNLITCSNEQLSSLKKMYPSKRMFFVHFPSLITKQIKEGQALVKELENVKNYILFFGNINQYKGVDILIKAFEDSEICEKTILVIAGRGEFKMINHKHIVRIDRFVKDEEIRSLYENASFVVYPYRSITMSGVLSLAFYFKKKTILSDLAFFRDYGNETTFFFRNGDIMDLRNKMEKLFEECDDTRPFPNIYERFYSDEVLKKEYYQLYSDLASM